MALITKIEEIQPFVAIGEGSYIDRYLPALDGVEQNYIIPTLGQPQYDLLQQAYTTGSGTIVDPDLSKLLSYVQRALANLAIAESMDFNQVRISEHGLTRTEKETEKTAYHYQKQEAQDYLFRQGFNGLESLLRFLESRKASYPAWANSEAYTLTQKYFISGAEDFQKYYNISRSRRTYQALMHIMDRLEMMVLEDMLGPDFMAYLKAKMYSGQWTLEEQWLVNRFIKPGLAYLVIAEATHELGLEYSEKGVQLQTRKSSQDNAEKRTPADNRLEIALNNARMNGNAFFTRMKSYLNEQASEVKFTIYFESSLYVNPSQDQKRSGGAVYNGL